MPEPLQVGDVVRMRRLEPGDVLMVAQLREDKDGKKFWWRFFLIVTERRAANVIEGLRVGAPSDREQKYIWLGRKDQTVHYLPPEEWPDGVHAFRMKAILEEKILGVI